MKKYLDADYLRKNYVDMGLSCRQIARMCDEVSAMTVWRSLVKYGIETRSQQEGYALRLMKGRNSKVMPVPGSDTASTMTVEELEELAELVGYEFKW